MKLLINRNFYTEPIKMRTFLCVSVKKRPKQKNILYEFLINLSDTIDIILSSQISHTYDIYI